MNYIEIIGIAAAVMILASAFFKNILCIRIINLTGAVMFCVYGLLTGALSVWILNGGLVITQIVQIIILKKQKRHELCKEKKMFVGTPHGKLNAHEYQRPEFCGIEIYLESDNDIGDKDLAQVVNVKNNKERLVINEKNDCGEKPVKIKACSCLLKKSEGMIYEDALCEIHDSEDKNYTAQINVDINGEQKEIRVWLYLRSEKEGDIFDIATNGIDIEFCPFCGRKL